MAENITFISWKDENGAVLFKMPLDIWEDLSAEDRNNIVIWLMQQQFIDCGKEWNGSFIFDTGEQK